MNKNRHPYNDFFQKKLDSYESEVPDDLFNRLMTDRSMREKLDKHDSPVNDDIFNQLMRNREGSDELPSDAPLRERLVEHDSVVTKPTFNDIIIERERRRRALVWRSSAAILLFFIAYLMLLNRDFIFNNNEIKIENNNDFNENKSQVNNDFNQNKNDKSLDFKENKIIIDDKNKIVKNLNERDNKFKKAINNDKFNENKDKIIKNETKLFNNSDKSLVLKKDKSFKSDNKVELSNNNLTTNSNSLENTEGAVLNSKQIDNQARGFNNNALNTGSNSANIITEHTVAQQIIIPTTPTNTDNSSVLVSGDKGVEDKDLKTDNRTGFNALSSTPDAPILAFDNLSILKVKNIAVPTKTLENPCAGPGDGCPTFGKKRQRSADGRAVYIDIYGAPEYAFRRLSENLPENANYLRARDSVEKPWYAFSAGARVSIVFNNVLALRTGFTYAQTNETAIFDSLGIGKKITTETYVPRTGGGQDTIRKTEITSGIFRSTFYNRYRSIDIPLQLGFEFPLNDYWSFSVNGGANFNISAWRKADILGEKGMRQDVSSGFGESNPVFNNALGISVFGSVAAYRQLTGNLQLVIEPSFRHYLQPMTRSDYGLKQAYTNGGLILGLRYRL